MLIWLVLFWMIMPNLYAANPYKLGQVDYFHQYQSKPAEQDFDWQEPLVVSNEQNISYIPPQPVRALLENPTPENAELYIYWQRQKIKRIIKAQEAIDKVLQERKFL